MKRSVSLVRTSKDIVEDYSDLSTYHFFNYENEVSKICCMISKEGKTAIIRYFEKEEVIFQWPSLSERDFEFVHGLFRTLNLIPDKVAYAITINNIERLFPLDPGSQMVELIAKLLKPGRPNPFYFRNSYIRLSIAYLEKSLELFKTSLEDRNQLEILVTAHNILEKAQRLKKACHFYLSFVHKDLLRTRQVASDSRVTEDEKFIQSSNLFLETVNLYENQPNFVDQFDMSLRK